MKNSSTKSTNRGFTLIELLVVIAIIAVLAAAGFAGGTAAMNKAKRLTAQNAASSVALAVNNFYSDNSALPDPGDNSADAQFTTTSGSGIKLLEILAAVDAGEQNAKKVRYLNVNEAKNGRGGIEYSTDGKSIKGMYDPFGQPFYIRMDYDYDERLSFTPQGSTAVTLNGRRVAVYSLGVPNPTDARANTLAKSW
jgi:prepilin-type N-terminal cleavage/methylation domain-containing protein